MELTATGPQPPAGWAPPERPRLRSLDMKWVEHKGSRYLHLRDPLSLAGQGVLVPGPLTPLLAMCDGTRDMDGMRAALTLRTGATLPDGILRDFVKQLDAAFLLENGLFVEAAKQKLDAYRSAPHRTMTLAGGVYPQSADGLRTAFASYKAKSPAPKLPVPPGCLAGIVSPHIDYHRGHKTYSTLWETAAPGLRGVELVLLFGTDHSGGEGMLTPTPQSYATPLGVLPTDRKVVNGLAGVLGEERAFRDELHHVGEHSIELAAVWLHYALGRAVPVVPVLCGSLHHVLTRAATVDAPVEAAVAYLQSVAAGRRTLVVAAGDLAHAGPTFGDPAPLTAVERASLTAGDAKTLEAICRGDADGVIALSRSERDARRLCGLPPIYMALRVLGGATGISLGYDQCPADARGGSVVSIAGALLYKD